MSTLVEIKPDGTTIEHEAGGHIPLERIQEMVGGYVQMMKVRYNGAIRHCYLNEDGQMKNLPVNDRFRDLVIAHHQRSDVQQFYGTAVIWVPSPRRKKNEDGG